MGGAREDRQVPPAEFMGLHTGARQGIPPDKRIIFRHRSPMSIEDTQRYADIENLQRSAKLPPRHQQMTPLARHEGDRALRPERCAKRHATPAAKPRGQIHGKNRHLRLHDRLDQPD